MSELISVARIASGWVFEMREEEESVEVRLRAEEFDLRNLGIAEPDTERAARTLGEILLERQRADDLPPVLELDDLAAAYNDLESEVHRRLS